MLRDDLVFPRAKTMRISYLRKRRAGEPSWGETRWFYDAVIHPWRPSSSKRREKEKTTRWSHSEFWRYWKRQLRNQVRPVERYTGPRALIAMSLVLTG
jgi:hypothetical protein